jgi:hypothetical protein
MVFLELQFVKPSSWFHPVTWERVMLSHVITNVMQLYLLFRYIYWVKKGILFILIYYL